MPKYAPVQVKTGTGVNTGGGAARRGRSAADAAAVMAANVANVARDLFMWKYLPRFLSMV
ncbi:hypothetical protein [Methylobacterium mesophilicum]|uniref:hypothetical protein n=1 Tax=Methylobacterium mesophilicum TaxID=39956 RepID=UPI0013036525